MKPDFSTNTLYFSERLQEKLPLLLQKKLAIIEAPMGCGKTVAVREFLRDKPVDAVWINFSQSAETNLWEFFCQSFEDQLPQYAHTVRQLRQLRFPVDEQSAHSCIKLLREAEFPRPTFFILDDYQLVNKPKSSQLLEALTRIGCPNAHVILLSRDQYCGTSEMMNLKGDLVYIEREDLALNEEDILQYYRRCGVELSREEARRLFRESDGWIGALYLYLLRYQEEGIIAFPMRMYELMDLEYFSLLSEESRAFLYAVSPLGRFTFQQADYVWEPGNTREILTGLRGRNPFVLYDDRTGRFYLHSVLRRFLERRVERLSDEDRAHIYARCGDWFLQEGDHYSAMEYYYRAKEFEQILATLARDQGDSITLERWPFFSRVLAECPAPVAARQVTAIFFLTISALLVGDEDQHRRYANFLRVCFADAPAGEPAHKQLAEMLAFVNCMQGYNDLETMTRCLHAAEPMDHALNLYTPRGPTLTMGASSALLIFHRIRGHMREELKQMLIFLPVFERVTGGLGAGSGELMEAEIFFQEGELEDARIRSHAAEVLARTQHRPSNVCCALFLQTRCALLAGDREGAADLMREMEALAQEDITQGKLIYKLVELSRAFLDAYTGGVDKVPNWIRTGRGMRRHTYLFAYPMFQIVYGRCLLLDKDHAKVVGYFQGLLGEAFYSRHMLFNIYAKIYIAAAQYAMGRGEEAQHTLTDALEEALPDRIYMPFAANFSHIQPLLDRLEEADPALRQEVDTISHLAGQMKEGVDRAVKRGRKERSALLTGREQELARLACAGKANGEIASELFLAESTVKRTMVDIFRKLGIHSRKELGQHREQFTEDGQSN